MTIVNLETAVGHPTAVSRFNNLRIDSTIGGNLSFGNGQDY
jgi:hypothetical protein